MSFARIGVLTMLVALAISACARTPRPVVDAGAVGAAFLASNAKAPGVHVTASGLQYRVIHSGPSEGPRPKPADEVKVNYEGKLLDGEVFDSSFERGTPMVATLDHLIPGWIEALQLMRPGDEWLIYVPSSLGYGPKGKGPIPPDSVMVFKIDLIGVLPDESSIGRG
ncbi:MAG TPA: FKBP-type peptidyl-prolyl cis-trans isomerase [Caulobacteraceae bacterium]